MNLRTRRLRSVLIGVLLLLIGAVLLLHPDGEFLAVYFGIAIVLGGLWLLGSVNRLVIDRRAGSVAHQRGWLVPMRTRRYSLSRIRSVRVDVKAYGQGERRYTRYPVRLSGVKATLAEPRDPFLARQLAERVAAALGVPMGHRLYGRSVSREATELDLPLVARWLRDDVRFEKPPMPSGTGLREPSPLGSRYELLIPADFPALGWLIAPLWLLAVPAVVDVGLAEIFHSTPYRVFAGFGVVAGALLLAFVGRSSLRISADEISFRQGWLPRRARLPLDAVEELTVAGDGVNLVGDMGALWVHWGGSKAASDYIEAVIPYQMLRLARYRREGGG